MGIQHFLKRLRELEIGGGLVGKKGKKYSDVNGRGNGGGETVQGSSSTDAGLSLIGVMNAVEMEEGRSKGEGLALFGVVCVVWLGFCSVGS